MKLLFLHGYSDSNKGDLAIVAASITALRKLFPQAEFTLQSVFSRQDPKFEEHHRFISQLGVLTEPMPIPSPYVDDSGHGLVRNLKALITLLRDACIQSLLLCLPSLGRFFPIPAKSLQHIREADIVFLKGGQYIYNDQGGIRGILYLWRILNPIQVAVRLGKPVVILGQSIGPVHGRIARQMTQKILKKCQRIVVREDLSANLMQEFGLSSTTMLAPDMAFLTVPKRPTSVDAILNQMETRPFLGVTVVNWSFPGSADVGASRKAYEQGLFEVCVRVHKELGMSVVLLPQVTVRHHGESDMDVIDRLEQRLQAAGVDVHAVRDDLWPEEFSYLYSRSKVLLGTRLHSCILAACGSCPVVAIRYQGFKTEGVMAGLGLGHFVHDISRIDATALFHSIQTAAQEHDALSAQIAGRVQAYQEKLYSVLQHEVETAMASR